MGSEPGSDPELWLECLRVKTGSKHPDRLTERGRCAAELTLAYLPTRDRVDRYAEALADVLWR